MKPIGTNADKGDPEEKRETGTLLILVAWLCWIFAGLVLFFRLSEMRMGGTALRDIAIGLGVLGVILYGFGRYVRRRVY
jgi:hypothetical protein